MLESIGDAEKHDVATLAVSEAAARAEDDDRAWELANQARIPAKRASARARLLAGREGRGSSRRVLGEFEVLPDLRARIEALTITAVALVPANMHLATLLLRRVLPLAAIRGSHETFWTLQRLTDVLAGLDDGQTLLRTLECCLEVSTWPLENL